MEGIESKNFSSLLEQHKKFSNPLCFLLSYFLLSFTSQLKCVYVSEIVMDQIKE